MGKDEMKLCFFDTFQLKLTKKQKKKQENIKKKKKSKENIKKKSSPIHNIHQQETRHKCSHRSIHLLSSIITSNIPFPARIFPFFLPSLCLS